MAKRNFLLTADTSSGARIGTGNVRRAGGAVISNNIVLPVAEISVGQRRLCAHHEIRRGGSYSAAVWDYYEQQIAELILISQEKMDQPTGIDRQFRRGSRFKPARTG